MKFLLDKFNLMRQKVPNDLILLIRPLLKNVKKAFMPGVYTINWTSFKCEEYFKFIQENLNKFETMTLKINDIASIQLPQFLNDISHTLMCDLPEDPMTVTEFMEKIKLYAAIVSKDLEYKSRACESAVIQLINTLLTATHSEIPSDLVYSWLNDSLFERKLTTFVDSAATLPVNRPFISRSWSRARQAPTNFWTGSDGCYPESFSKRGVDISS